jgi:hypothetical protein
MSAVTGSVVGVCLVLGAFVPFFKCRWPQQVSAKNKKTLYKLHNDLTYSHEAHNNYAYIHESGDGDIYEVEGGRIRHEKKAAQLAELHGNYKELGIFEKGIGS